MYENNVQVEPILLKLYSDRIIKQINLMTTINMKGTYIFGWKTQEDRNIL